MKMTINKKLFAGFGAVLIVLSFIVVVSYYEILSIARTYNNLVTVEVEELVAVKDIEISIRKGHASLRGYALLKDAKSKSSFTDAQHDFETLTKELIAKHGKNSEEYKLLTKLQQTQQTYYTFSQTIFQLVASNNDQVVKQRIASEGRQLIINADRQVTQLSDYYEKRVKAQDKATNAFVQKLATFIVVLGIIAVIVGISVSLLIGRNISRPIVKLASLAKIIASGDLTSQRIVVQNRDELGELAQSFNDMVGSLRHLIEQVSASAHQLSSSSEELTASAEQASRATAQIADNIQGVADGVDVQVKSVNEGTTTVNELSARFQQISANTETVSAQAMEASGRALEGNTAITTVIDQMNSINRTVHQLAMVVEKLGEQSTEVHQIIDVIRNISAQTNLLSLNAAIEAARAGEHGRGFDVVANEVRKLAQQSAHSAKQIAELISSIQGGMMDAVQSMGTVTAEVTRGIDYVQHAGQSFEKIKDVVENVTSHTQEVTAEIQQITASVNGMTNSMNAILEVTKQSAANTQEVSAATEQQLASSEEIASSSMSLSRMAEHLQQSISRFKI